jgi:hypothetical protein
MNFDECNYHILLIVERRADAQNYENILANLHPISLENDV